MIEFTPIERKKATQEQIDKGLELLNKKLEYEAKVKAGEIKPPKKWKDLSPAEKEKAKEQAKKYAARLKAVQSVKDQKLEKAGIKISEAEIQAEMKRLEAK